LDLFHKVLGWSKTTARRQDSNIDIVLCPYLNTTIVIEVKKLSDFKYVRQRNDAICQGSKYLLACKPSQHFGIVTDGITWSFFTVRKFAAYYRAHRLLEFRVDKHDKLAKATFKRLAPGSIKRFFRTLAAVHEDMSAREFDSLMNLSFERRLEKLAAKSEGKGIKIADGELRILREFYTGGRIPVGLFEAISAQEPVKITKGT